MLLQDLAINKIGRLYWAKLLSICSLFLILQKYKHMFTKACTICVNIRSKHTGKLTHAAFLFKIFTADAIIVSHGACVRASGLSSFFLLFFFFVAFSPKFYALDRKSQLVVTIKPRPRPMLHFRHATRCKPCFDVPVYISTHACTFRSARTSTR